MSDKRDLSIFHDVNAPAQIRYTPTKEPAWPRHLPTAAPKAQRFARLNRWESTTGTVNKVVRAAVVAAGAAAVAAPALSNLIH